jgi:hypothetical protein
MKKKMVVVEFELGWSYAKKQKIQCYSVTKSWNI